MKSFLLEVEYLIVNIMAVDGLAMQWARALAAMILTKFSKNILASTPGELNCVSFIETILKCGK